MIDWAMQGASTWGLAGMGLFGAALAAALGAAWASSSGAADQEKMSRTAFALICYRAIAAQDPDPHTRNPDHLAQRLAQALGICQKMDLTLDFDQAIQAIDRDRKWVFYYINARTKHIDAVLGQAAREGAGQVVLLGAGFDTRAQRFHAEFPGLRFFEVDLPAMSATKQRIVNGLLADQPAHVTYAPIDFATQELGQVLAEADWDPAQPTLFIWEGVTMYLDAGAVDATLGLVAQTSAPGSRVVFDYLPFEMGEGHLASEEGRALAQRLAAAGEPFKFGMDPQGLADRLAGLGLELESNLGHEELTARYMTMSDGGTRGKLPRHLMIATARVPDRG